MTDIIHKIIVPNDIEGIENTRIDRFLADQMPELSRSLIKAFIEDGKVSIDGKAILNPSYKIKIDSEISIIVPPPTEAIPIAQKIPLNIVYEDDDVIVVNKPVGLSVHPGAGQPDGTLVNALLYHCRDKLSSIGGVLRPGIVHRIDKDTSGIMIVAKNDKAHQSLSTQFADHTIERRYVAIIWGAPTAPRGVVHTNIARCKHNRQKMTIVQQGGKEAITHWKVIQKFADNGFYYASLIQCRLETGRTHHSTGHSLVGDQVYGGGHSSWLKKISPEIQKTFQNFKRQALHAKSLGFIHPSTGERVFFDSELPQDFIELIDVAGYEMA
jgi:23S rRNA pseudouridine1911/1915/1917 synthase